MGNKYRIGRKIGSGSFGDIYLGKPTLLLLSSLLQLYFSSFLLLSLPCHPSFLPTIIFALSKCRISWKKILRNSPVGLYLLCFTNEEKNIILAPDLSARHQCALKTSKNNNSAGSPPCHLSLSFCRLFSPLEPVLAHMHNGSSLYSLSPPSPLRPIAILCFPVHFIPFFVLPSCLS